MAVEGADQTKAFLMKSEGRGFLKTTKDDDIVLEIDEQCLASMDIAGDDSDLWQLPDGSFVVVLYQVHDHRSECQMICIQGLGVLSLPV